MSAHEEKRAIAEQIRGNDFTARIRPHPPSAPWNRRPPRGHADTGVSVEQLTRVGLLKVVRHRHIGVGINVPIRSGHTSLVGSSGSADAGAASPGVPSDRRQRGPSGLDTCGYVVVQAPEHEIENERLLPRPGTTPKLSPDHALKAPEGIPNWNRSTFDKVAWPNLRSSSPASTSTTRWCSTWHTAPRAGVGIAAPC